jgi:hypothetical protein
MVDVKYHFTVLLTRDENININDMDFSLSMGFETGQAMRLIRRQQSEPTAVVKRGTIVCD